MYCTVLYYNTCMYVCFFIYLLVLNHFSQNSFLKLLVLNLCSQFFFKLLVLNHCIKIVFLFKLLVLNGCSQNFCVFLSAVCMI